MTTDTAILLLIADLQRDKAAFAQRVAELEAERDASTGEDTQ